MSDINPNNIDREFPVAGQDQSSEGFRQNFTATADNFVTAKREITDLQNKVLLKAALTGSLLNNDMAGAIIQSATMRDMRLSVFPITDFPMNAVVVDPINGTYQYASLVAGNYNLQIAISPINNTITQIFLEISAAQGTSIQFQGSSSGVSYQGLQAIAGVVNTTNGPTLVFQRAADRNAGTARIFSIVIRSTSSSGGSSGVITVTDVSDLQTRVRVGEPTSQGTSYIGSLGDRQGDIRITPPDGTIGAKIWWCYRDYDGGNSIWSQAVGSDKDLSPQGPANSVQINDAANGVFQGDSTFVFAPPTRNQSNVATARGLLTLGTIPDGAVDANIWGNVNFVAAAGLTGNINLPGNGYVNANLIGNVRGTVTGDVIGNITGVTANISTASVSDLTVGNATVAKANIVDATAGSLYLAGIQFVPLDVGTIGSQNYSSLVAGGDLPPGATAFRDMGPSRSAEGAVQFWTAANSRAFSGNSSLTWSSNILSVAGNVAAANITSNVDITSIGGNITAVANGFNMTGGYITANFFSGDGRFLSNLNFANAVGGYNDTNVQALLSGGTVQTIDMAPAGNIRSDFYLNRSGANVLYSNANVAMYLPSYSGRMGNLDFNGNSLTTLGCVTITSGTLTLPNVASFSIPGGSNAQVLTTHGNGVLYWSTPTGGGGIANAAGNSGEVQFHAIGGGSGLQATEDFAFDLGSRTLTIGNNTDAGDGNIIAGGLQVRNVQIVVGGNILASQANAVFGNISGNGAGLTGLGKGPAGVIQLSGGTGAVSYDPQFSIADGEMIGGNINVSGNIEMDRNLEVGGNARVVGEFFVDGFTIVAPNAAANLNSLVTAGNVDVVSAVQVLGIVDSNQLRGTMISNVMFFTGLGSIDEDSFFANGRLDPSNVANLTGGNIYIQDYSSNGANSSNALLTVTTLGIIVDGDDAGNVNSIGSNAYFGNAYFRQEGNIIADYFETLGQFRANTESNIYIGGGVAGYVLKTDGAGGLTWQPSVGGFGPEYVVQAITTASPANVTTAGNHSYANSGKIVFSGLSGTDPGWATLNNKFYYVRVTGSDTFTIFTDPALTQAVDTSTFTNTYTANSGNVLGVSSAAAGGGNTAIQFNNGGAFDGTSRLTWNSISNVLAVTGNVTATYFIGDGSQLTGLPAGYSNAQAANYLASNANIAITVGGNITAPYYYGNAAFLTGIALPYSNANVAAYLPTYTGNIGGTGGYYTGNISLATGGYGNADVITLLGSNSNILITTQSNITTSANLRVTGTIIANNISTTGSGNTLISSGAVLTLRAANGAGLINAEAIAMNFTGRVIGNLVSTTAAPSSATDTGSAGQIAVDANYIYICVATNTWKRAALSTW